MIASADSSDRSDADASFFDYEEFFSVLMYYTPLKPEDIRKHSRGFLLAIYQHYANRACENLGVSPDPDSKSGADASGEGYPSEFVTFSQAEREKMIEESGESDSDFLSKFRGL